MICAVVSGPTLKDIYRQMDRALVLNVDLVELRLDLFQEINNEWLKKIRSSFSIPMIFTLRSKQQGGVYEGKTSEYIQSLKELAELLPEYLDIESHLSKEIFEEFKIKYSEIKVICSYHNFINIPENLSSIYLSLKNKSAFFYKIAVMAENSLDALKMLIWTKQQDQKLIGISMGVYGQISRILGPMMGSRMTYAPLEEEAISAPGQIPLEILFNRYHHCSLNVKTKIFGLIGVDIEKSLSHHTHNELIKFKQLDAVYFKISVRPEHLSLFLDLAKQIPFCGISITMPHKKEIMAYLDEIEWEAKKIDAVNTLVFKNGKIFGHNTDGAGAIQAIERKLFVSKKRILILGAGGAAKAIAYEACKRGAKVIILNRNVEKARLLAEMLNCSWGSLNEIEGYANEGYDLLINCTSLLLPIDPRFILSSSMIMDINSYPKDTILLQEAKKKGCRIIYGYEMFVEQAVKQFELWFGSQISSEECREILEKSFLGACDKT